MNLQKNAASRKKIVLAVLGLITLCTVIFWLQTSHPLSQALTQEWIENSFPEKIDEELNPNPTKDTQSWTVLPMGYTLGAWPVFFQGEPIVTKLTYQKGPPKKFIQSLVQVWKPVEVELTIEGPRTIDTKLTGAEWKKCFSSRFLCRNDKVGFLKYAFPELLKADKDSIKSTHISWFESMDPLSARGVHFQVAYNTYTIDRYTVITDRGAVQNFSLKVVNSPTGGEAQILMAKIIGGMKVKDELAGSRVWIQNKIQSVQLNQIRGITDAKFRMMKLIQVQNWIFSLLTVDPTLITPFFHLAGVTHLLAMDLLKSKTPFFENQEAWILNSKPQLETLIKYARDFETSDANTQAIKNMESLLQDFLLAQQRATGTR